jgi:hypothetical protein
LAYTALALLGLARARALTGNFSASRLAYQDFLVLWKDADPEIPVLQQARAEYARLHWLSESIVSEWRRISR